MTEKAEIKKEEEVKRYIMREKRIDKFTVKRRRVLITPSVCDVCAIDLREVNNIRPEYKDLPEDIKVRLKLAVADHKKQVHDTSQQRIITEDQLPVAYLKELVVKKDKDSRLKELTSLS